MLAATLTVMALLTVQLPAGVYVKNLCVNRDTCNLIFISKGIESQYNEHCARAAPTTPH